MPEAEIAIIVALLPLAAAMVVCQTNPYYALIVRGILGAIAALVYSVLGAADVALTEALVGTMLAITLYAVAVRSSLVMRLGVIAPPEPIAPVNELLSEAEACPLPSVSAETGLANDSVAVAPALAATVDVAQSSDRHFTRLVDSLRQCIAPHYLRLELVPYSDARALHQAFLAREVHATCLPADMPLAANADLEPSEPISEPRSLTPPYQIALRIRRLHEIVRAESLASLATLTYVGVSDSQENKS